MIAETTALSDPDAFYAAFCEAHDGLPDEDSAAFNIRLVFLLANQVADQAILEACLRAARLDAPA